jgi:tetratricopeptide (TPR) repeat protein
LLLACYLGLLPEAAAAQTKAPVPNFAVLSQRAAEARDADRLDQAVVLYTKALMLRPRWIEGWWALGTMEYDQNHYDKAAVDFAKLIALNSANGTAHAMLGLCQFELGKDELALKNLKEADHVGIVNNEELRKVALYHLGVLQLRAHKFGDAHESLFQLAQQRIRSEELLTALGQASLLISPQDSPVEDSAKNLIERAGEAEAFSATKDFDRAKQLYTGLTNQFPNYPNLHFAYGRMLLEAHETDQAVEEFHRELDRDPKNVNSMLEIASVRYQVDSQEGLKYAEQAVNLAPGLPFAHYLLGLLRLDTGDAAGAIPELEIAQKAFPKQPKIYFALGNAYSRIGRKSEAANARAEFLRLDKQSGNQPGSNVYGERPAGVSEGQMQKQDREAAPQ